MVGVHVCQQLGVVLFEALGHRLGLFGAQPEGLQHALAGAEAAFKQLAVEFGHAPVARAHVKQGVLTVAELAAAAVEVSDNSAANLLLPLIGGPRGLTAFMRRHGDAVTRLDRTEPALNENRPGDPRDTTSPAAMSRLIARLLHRDLSTASAGRLRGWLMASTTGVRRIRAGFPAGWTIGDKTGTCGTAYNDVAILRSPHGRDYVLAVYLDRPRVGSEQADAMIAEVGRVAARLLIARERH